MGDRNITVTVKSNEIDIPMEWSIEFESVPHDVQITLVDDRIVIHKPLNAAAEYTAPCKVDDNSYIRAFGLFSVKVPKQLLDRLNINVGDKIDLTLEEHCISFRKNTDAELSPSEIEPTEPMMAFCCVCGKLLHTESLLKVLNKYICLACVDVVKAL